MSGQTNGNSQEYVTQNLCGPQSLKQLLYSPLHKVSISGLDDGGMPINL